MSLRDQLVQKGLVSKKHAQKIAREVQAEQRVERGNQKSKADQRAEAEAARAAAEAEATARRIADRKAREAEKAEVERRLRIVNLLAGNRLRPGAGQPFWHKSLDGKQVLRMEVSSGVAYQLRCGELAIAGLQRQGDIDYVLIPNRAADKLAEFAPEHLVFRVTDPTGISDADHAFLRRTWEPSLAAHRAGPDDLRRFAPPR
ncbi:MAG: DUF2058 family protein [Myxococcota bacterium]